MFYKLWNRLQFSSVSEINNWWNEKLFFEKIWRKSMFCLCLQSLEMKLNKEHACSCWFIILFPFFFTSFHFLRTVTKALRFRYCYCFTQSIVSFFSILNLQITVVCSSFENRLNWKNQISWCFILVWFFFLLFFTQNNKQIIKITVILFIF